MKVFQTLRRIFTELGIDLYHPIQTHKLTVRNLIVFLIFFETFISSGVYGFCVANGFNENIESLHAFSVTIICLAVFSITIQNRPKLVKFIENVENFIEKSE